MTKRTKETVMGIIGLLIMTIVIGLAGHIETHYYRKDCKVIKTVGQAVYVVDKTNNEWCYIAEEVPTIGTRVDLKMFTAYTDNTVEDDEIVKVKIR